MARTKWRTTFHLKQFLSEDDSPENARVVAEKIADVLKTKLRYSDDGELENIIEELKEIAQHGADPALDLLNETLASLYDWADDESVWIA